ncbi:MAG TPA: lantibiotic dehydratase, partial [Blastocatellia bacterium]|nr:lantibiotic dehydratase [Blastocatellia bacterium]
ILTRGDSSLRDEGEIFEILDWMQKRGMISWTLALPPEVKAGDRLKAMLEAIEDEELRRGAMARFSEIDSAIQNVSRSTENADQLYTALTHLEERFTGVTGAASTRGAGATYAARTLVYEDCRRDMDVQIGSEILQELKEPLSLLLTSARWFTWEVAKVVRGMMKQVYEELARSTESRTVDFISLWTRVVNPLLLSDDVQLYDPLTSQLQKKWEDILQIDTEKRQVEYKTEELRAKVNRAFPAPRPGWRFARYHSPDVMIAAPSVEAIQRGEHQFVLGEIHIGTNTLRASLFVAQHPSPEELFEAIDSDFPQPRVIAALPKHWGGTTTSRTTVALVAPKDYWLEVALDSPSGAQKSQVLTLGELIVVEGEGGLQVRTRDSRLSFDIVEFFGELLSSQVINRLRIESSGRHTPRVSFDRLVVSREAWQFSASELAFALIKDEVERFVQARKWARSLSIPRFAFVRVPVEIKPFYVDFDSPLYVGIFAKMVRRTLEAADAKGDEVTVREMLPGLDMLWLADNEQARYTSELRIVAVDLAT